MSHYKLALLGFGNVGRALARLLQSKQTELLQRYNITFDVTGIATGRHGRRKPGYAVHDAHSE